MTSWLATNVMVLDDPGVMFMIIESTVAPSTLAFI